MKILADTSIWVEHLREPDPRMARLIAAGDLLLHPGVCGELAVGNLPARPVTLAALRNHAHLHEVPAADALAFIERHRLYGRGLGWVDVQLLAAVEAAGHRLWTLDKRLETAAQSLGLAWTP